MAVTAQTAMSASRTLAKASPDVTPTAETLVTAGGGPRRLRWYRRQRLLVSTGALLAAMGVALGAWQATRGGPSTSAFTVSTQQVKVTTGTIKKTVAASGTIQPGQEANLSFAVSGLINAVNVSSGQKVTKGQTLATITSTALQDQVAAAQATLSADQARLSSDTSAGATISQLDSDQAAVTSAQLAVSTAATNLANAALTSTIDGTVASVSLTVGQQVSAGGSSASAAPSSGAGSSTGGSGAGGSAASQFGSSATQSSSSSSSSSTTTAQIVVVSTSSYLVSATVDDTEVGQVKAGDQAVITPGGSTAPVYGTVSSVGLIATGTSGVASFPVTIAVTGTPSGLYAGATATVSIVTQVLNNVTDVPTAAITYSNGQATVTELRSGKHVTQSVTTGASASGETQITAGIKAGTTIIEKVVKFNTSGAAGNILGGTGGAPGTRGGFGGAGGGFGGGGFGGGGFGGARTGTGAGG
jgi:multidrug efflux pump subunit AcrA (membrane-fusion protein)